MSDTLAELLVPVPAGSLVSSIPCPNAYFAYPDIRWLARAPEAELNALNAIWRRSIQHGRAVNAYKLNNVFVAAEGLVFDEQGRLIDVTRTYHTRAEVLNARDYASDAIKRRACPEIQRGILTKSRGSTNYGHFLVEMLPRAWLARRLFGAPDWPAIIDTSSPAVTNIARQALQIAGFGENEIMGTTADPVFVGELIVVDGLTIHSAYLSPIVMQCLDALADPIAAAPATKIFAERYPGKTRDFENLTEVTRELAANGFRPVRTADLSFAEQIALFKGAEAVVGPTGAALTNIVFCNPGTPVVNFSPSGAREVFFWMIAEVRRLRYREIRCREVGPASGPLAWDRAITISRKELRQAIAW